jgi:hypothetical protein
MVEGSIEVPTQQTSPEVAGHHSIRIHHRQYFENDPISELFGLRRAEIVQQSVEYPAALGFARVQSANHQHHILLYLLFALDINQV